MTDKSFSGANTFINYLKKKMFIYFSKKNTRRPWRQNDWCNVRDNINNKKIYIFPIARLPRIALDHVDIVVSAIRSLPPSDNTYVSCPCNSRDNLFIGAHFSFKSISVVRLRSDRVGVFRYVPGTANYLFRYKPRIVGENNRPWNVGVVCYDFCWNSIQLGETEP